MQMKYVFIDTNILLAFYSYSNDHLNKLEELAELIKDDKIHLIMPQQVIDEFNRNRENQLQVILKNLKSFNPNLKSPVICHDLSEMKELQKSISKLSEKKDKLIKEVSAQIKSKSLNADKLIKQIFSLCKIIPVNDEIYKKGKMRYDIGNPPGKNGSYGDAINWEILLVEVPGKEDLYFIGRDKDYVSTIDENDFSDFLKDEWESNKDSKIYYYNYLSKFLKEQFAGAKITDAEIKEEKTAAEQEPKIYFSGSLLNNNLINSPFLFSNYMNAYYDFLKRDLNKSLHDYKINIGIAGKELSDNIEFKRIISPSKHDKSDEKDDGKKEETK